MSITCIIVALVSAVLLEQRRGGVSEQSLWCGSWGRVQANQVGGVGGAGCRLVGLCEQKPCDRMKAGMPSVAGRLWEVRRGCALFFRHSLSSHGISASSKLILLFLSPPFLPGTQHLPGTK